MPNPLAPLESATPAGRRSGGALAALALLVLAAPWPAGAAEPLSSWLDGLGEAAAALDAGDAARSLAAAHAALEALPAGPAGARASAAVGLAQLELGAAALAVGSLRAALDGAEAASDPALRLALGRALLAAGRPAAAAAALERVASHAAGSLARRARRLQAQALVASGSPARAAPLLEALLRDAPEASEAAALRLELAGAQRLLGRADRALSLYRALALEEPDRPEGGEALQALTRWREAGGPVPPLSGEDRLARAERLLARGLQAAALAEVDLATAASPPAEPARAALQRALILLALGRLAEAEALALPLAAPGQAAGVRRSATWVVARVAARGGRTEEAVRAYAQVAVAPGGLTGLPEPRWRDLGDEAAYLAAWLWYDAGDLRRAIRGLEAFPRAHPTSRRADDARWFAAWAHLRLGERAEARRGLARLEAGALADAGLYWQGRLAPTSAGAAAFYRRAQAAGPDGWYAALAAARLAAPGPGGSPAGAPPPVGSPGPLAPLVLEQGPAGRRLTAAAALLALGWRELARSELEDLLRRRPSASVAAPLAELASFAGEADLPFRAARDQLGTSRRTLRWLFPEPLPALERLAERAGVDPDLLRAVVRKESAFRPDARSAAGAVGLTQLLPATASRLDAVAGLTVDESARLPEPETNLGLGAHYLGLLQDRFGSQAVALAAYNAGPRPAAAWSRDRAGLPLDEWVEGIPYKETRGYVKAVLAARLAYRRLAGRADDLDPARPVPAPAEGVAF